MTKLTVTASKDPSTISGEWVVVVSHPSREFSNTDRFNARKWTKKAAIKFTKEIYSHWES